MSEFNPNKLHVTFKEQLQAQTDLIPRKYTLTHSDATGDLFLTIGPEYDTKQISGWYTRLMRDEALAEWQANGEFKLVVHCHVSGGLVLGSANWRNKIFIHHLPLVMQVLVYGDRDFIQENPELQTAPIIAHFHAKQKALDRTEPWGTVTKYLPK